FTRQLSRCPAGVALKHAESGGRLLRVEGQRHQVLTGAEEDAGQNFAGFAQLSLEMEQTKSGLGVYRAAGEGHIGAPFGGGEVREEARQGNGARLIEDQSGGAFVADGD